MRESSGLEENIKKVVVFIPAYNEEDKIGETISIVKDFYSHSELRGFKVESIVVDDGSTDETSEIVQKNNIDSVSHPYNLGLGAATRTGMQSAYERGADVAVKFDADLQHSVEDIEKVVRPILDNKADIVFGSRFTGQIKYKMPFIRYYGNIMFTRLMRVLTGWPITDAQTGLMAYSKRYLAVFNMPGDYNPPHQILIDAYHQHMRYVEVPVVFYPRTTGKSFVSLRYPFKAMMQILRILVMVNPLKVFVFLSCCFWIIAFVWGGIEFYLNAFINHSIEIHDTSILVLIICGIQAFFFGLLADLISHKR